MIFPSQRVRIMVATKPVDFRKGHDGLAALVKNELHKNPFTGTVFVFRSKRADRLSGGSMQRPALKRLLQDIEAGKIDSVVVYKVDRLSRSLSDFVKMVEIFDDKGVSFVSVTQQFNTTTSMGRLTLNMLLSFAQFEREVTGERIRDKIAASKKKGMWMGSLPPLGYDVDDRKLVINETEASTVNHIYRRYLELGSVRLLKEDLDRQSITSKQRINKRGRRSGGLYVRFPLSLRNVEDLLHERGIDISHETVRYWWNRFGPVFAAEIRKNAFNGNKHTRPGDGIWTKVRHEGAKEVL